MLRLFLCTLLLLVTICPVSAAPAPAQSSKALAQFPIAAHNDVNIEWWYVNAHVKTDKGRRLALIGSFFRFGNGRSVLNSALAMPRGHYLIYAVTDLDKPAHRSYSIADVNTINHLKQVAPFLVLTTPGNKSVAALAKAVAANKVPAPHQKLSGKAQITNHPFRISYGSQYRMAATNAAATAFTLDLDNGKTDRIHLTFRSEKPMMAVGGKGQTGLQKPTDMYYYSLTRCAVGGTVDVGGGTEKIVSGSAWFDHQWGNSWVAQNNGWDWWGVQLDNGTDILFFRQRDLATGKVFFPLATFMDKDGKLTVTKKIVFTPDPRSYYDAPGGARYPLSWNVEFPEQKMRLKIDASVPNQVIPILGPGGDIWEGLCDVSATIYPDLGSVQIVRGIAYMELVGYNSPSVKVQGK